MEQQLIDIYMIDAGNRGFSAELKQHWPQLPAMVNCRVCRGSVYSHYLLITTNEKGYPFRSISHSGLYCICGAGLVSLGIDIECKRAICPDGIPEGFSRDSLQFLRQWTAGEAYFKMLGKKAESVEQAMLDATLVYWENEYYVICVCAPKKMDIRLRLWMAAGWKQWKEIKER